MGLQSAFVFVKPHANKHFVIEEVKRKFAEKEVHSRPHLDGDSQTHPLRSNDKRPRR